MVFKAFSGCVASQEGSGSSLGSQASPSASNSGYAMYLHRARYICTFSRLSLMSRRVSLSQMSGTAAWMGKRWIHDQMNAIAGNDFHLPFDKPKTIRLLVDGDCFGSEQVQYALTFLAQYFDRVKAVIFAAPGLAKSRSMDDLLRQSDISFYPVPRGQNQAAEPNDEVIISEMRKRSNSRSPRNECMALLTGDKGFAQCLSKLISDKQPVFVLIPNSSVSVVSFYKDQGIPVIPLPKPDAQRSEQSLTLKWKSGAGRCL